MKYFLPFILLATLANSQEQKIHKLEFPDLGPTLLELHTGEKRVPSLIYQLPENFSPDETYPVFVFLTGGDGKSQETGGLGRARAITGGKDYIAVSLPIYRNTEKLDEDALFGDLLLGVDDYPAIKRAYQPMLKKFFDTVPQAKKTGNVMGGFSNGAHTVSILLSCQDEVVLKHFSQFIFADGGIWLSGLQRQRMKKCRFLGLFGDTDTYWTRPVIMQQFKTMKMTADALEIDFELIEMKGVGHKFPSEYDPKVLAWMKRQ